MDNKTIEFLATRENPIITSRKKQFEISQSAYYGGKQYLDKRLRMFPNESLIDFQGGSRWDGQSVIGRKQYTPYINYCRQIADDINNLTFFNEPVREGGNENIINNINGFNDNVDEVMMKANLYYTLYNWSWLKVDIPSDASMSEMSLLEKEQLDIRPFWYAIQPGNVVDWDQDRFGLKWILEEDYETINISPTKPCINIKVRRLWEPGRVTTIKSIPSKDKRRKQEYSVEVKDLSYGKLPWVLIGTPSIKPNMFETIESINAHILNLESSNADLFINSAFPQPYITEKSFEKLYQQQLSKFSLASMNNGNTLSPTVYNENAAIESAFNLAVGTKKPIILGEGDSPIVPQMPGGLEVVREEIQANIANLQKISGIDLSNKSSQDASGIARAFDMISVQAIVTKRNSLLETAEKQAVIISSEWDSDFQPWTVTYNPNLTPEMVRNMENIPQPNVESSTQPS